MTRIGRISGLALALAALAGCGKAKSIATPAPSSGSADFRRVVAIGTSVSAGFESGGLVIHHQQKAFPYAFAHQAGAASFTIPGVSPAGIPPLLYIQSFNPFVIDTTGRSRGTELNAAQPQAFHNLAVPRAILADVVTTNFYGRDPATSLMFDIVVRGRGTVLGQALSLNPTFVTFEMGANEVLGPASVGLGTPLIPPEDWALLLTFTMNSLAPGTSSRKVAIFTVPDVTSLPFFTTVKPRQGPGGVCPVLGPGGPLSTNDLVLLPAAPLLAAGQGLPSPCGTGVPLPDTLILYAANAASIQLAIDRYNDAIDSVAARPNVVRVDLNGLLRRAASEGFTFQGSDYNSEYLTGGLFSLDGIHPTDLGHGFICNALIDAVNGKFGAHIAHVNLAEFATATSSRLRPAVAGEPPAVARGVTNPLAGMGRVGRIPIPR